MSNGPRKRRRLDHTEQVARALANVREMGCTCRPKPSIRIGVKNGTVIHHVYHRPGCALAPVKPVDEESTNTEENK